MPLELNFCCEESTAAEPEITGAEGEEDQAEEGGQFDDDEPDDELDEVDEDGEEEEGDDEEEEGDPDIEDEDEEDEEEEDGDEEEGDEDEEEGEEGDEDEEEGDEDGEEGDGEEKGGEEEGEEEKDEEEGGGEEPFPRRPKIDKRAQNIAIMSKIFQKMAVSWALTELQKDLRIKSTAGQIPPFTESEEQFREHLTGMTRSFSQQSSAITLRKSNVFDEESRDPDNFDICHSGEMRFNNSDHVNQSQTDVAELAENLQNEASYSPTRLAGIHSPDRCEHFPITVLKSDVQRFSEEEIGGGLTQKPIPGSMLKGPLPFDEQACCATRRDLSRIKKEPTPEPPEEEEECEHAWKYRVLMEAGFPPLWGAPFGLPFCGPGFFPMFQPGVPVKRLRPGQGCPNAGTDEECPMKEAGVCEDDGEGCVCNKNFKGKIQVYVDESDNEDMECKRVPVIKKPPLDEIKEKSDVPKGGATKGDAIKSGTVKEGSTTAGETDAESDDDKASSIQSVLSILKKCNEDESEVDLDDGATDTTAVTDILAAVKAKKAIYEAEIALAMPIREELIGFFSKGQFKGGKVDVQIGLYRKAVEVVRATKAEYRGEMEKLGINVNDDLGIDSLDSLLNRFKKEEKVADCGSKNLLNKLERDLANLCDSLPFDEFNKLRFFMKDQDDDDGGDGDDGPDKAGGDKKTGDGLCFPFCDVTCRKPEKNKKKSEFRDEMINQLNHSIFMKTKNRQPKRAGGDALRRKRKREVSEPIVVAARQEEPKFRQKRCLYTTAPGEDKMKRAQCFETSCDGRKDFRELVGIEQLKALFPLLLRIEKGGDCENPVRPAELYKVVKNNQIKSWDFKLETATMLCEEWKKTRKIAVDEALYAIKNPTAYLKLVASGNLNQKLPSAIRAWVSQNPKAIQKIEPAWFPKPRNIYNIPKPSKGVSFLEDLTATDLAEEGTSNYGEVYGETIKASTPSGTKNAKSSTVLSPSVGVSKMVNFKKRNLKLQQKPPTATKPTVSRQEDCKALHLEQFKREQWRSDRAKTLTPSTGTPKVKSGNACKIEDSVTEAIEKKNMHNERKQSDAIKLTNSESVRIQRTAYPIAEIMDESKIQRMRRSDNNRRTIDGKLESSHVPANFRRLSGAGRPNPPAELEMKFRQRPEAAYERYNGMWKYGRLEPIKSVPLTK